jgi:hypothetical protein
VNVNGYYKPERSPQFVRDAMQDKINARLQQFSRGIKFANVVQFLVAPSTPAPHKNNKRRLMQASVGSQATAVGVTTNGMIKWDGTIQLLLQKQANATSGVQDIQIEVFRNYLKCAFFLANITTDEAGTSKPDCILSDITPAEGLLSLACLLACLLAVTACAGLLCLCVTAAGEGFIEGFFVSACQVSSFLAHVSCMFCRVLAC